MGLEREEVRPYSIGRNCCSRPVDGMNSVDEVCYLSWLFWIHQFAAAPLVVRGKGLWNSFDPVMVVTIVS